MATTLGELVLRRKLETRENPLTGIIYIPGQFQAQIVGDDAIVSFVDGGGWAVQAFLQRDGENWGMKSDIIICTNPYGTECRRVGRAFAGTDSVVAALQVAERKAAERREEAERKKKASRQQRQREAPSTTG